MRIDAGLPPRGVDDPPVAVTIGNFDGVHRGHLALLDATQAAARRFGGQTVVVTFDPHPRCVLDPPNCPPALTTTDEKAEMLARAGADRVVVLHFTREVSRWPADFFSDRLRESFDLRALVLGHDFALGHKRAGDLTYLREYGSRHGIQVESIPAVMVEGAPVSSSRVRAAVVSGDVGAAGESLGHAYFLDGPVEHGEEVGRHLGFPTANLAIPMGKCLPAPGVYATWVCVEGGWHMAATNVGYRPTFGGDRLTVEAYLLDFDGDIYGKNVRAAFVSRLREERAYANVDDLVVQIGADVEATRQLLVRCSAPVESLGGGLAGMTAPQGQDG